jgi:alpha-L-fucosidase
VTPAAPDGSTGEALPIPAPQDPDGGTNQQWQLLPVGSNTYRIANRTTGLALDSGGAVASGSRTKQRTLVESPNLRWVLAAVG